MTEYPGVGGSLFPLGFLSDLTRASEEDRGNVEAARAGLLRWWARVERLCGPATALRALFDLVAMPLAAQLGFRARDAQFDRRIATARLEASRARLHLILLPWSSRLPSIWRDVHVRHDASSAVWALVVAPPFVSIVDLRGRAVRRSVDFRLPHALDPRSAAIFLQLCRAAAFADGEQSDIARLVTQASQHQEQVRRDLQRGVETALTRLQPVLRGQSLDEALTIVYRLLFLLFAESRRLTAAGDVAAGEAYGVTTLCRDARRGCDARGLWSALAAITRLSRAGCRSNTLIVAPFNGQLFSRAAAPTLESGDRARRPGPLTMKRDDALGATLVALGSRETNAGRQAISYADLGVEQLGAVYERVLDLDRSPATTTKPARVRGSTHSARRKEHGTFYTPQPLAEYVVRRTLAPLLRDRSADQILRLRVLDPAMGSGAFLVAACRYLADSYERALINEGRYAEGDFDETRRAVIRRLVASQCLAGVDVNPTAVQLARLSLWLTTLARDKPLSFLDHQLRVGNSLLGASPDDLWRTRRKSSSSAPVERPLFEAAGLEGAVRGVLGPMRELRARADDSVEDVHARERLWRQVSGQSSPLASWRLACDLWCSQWFSANGGRTAAATPAETRAAIDAVLKSDRVLPSARLDALVDAARDAADRQRFFHWPLEFPDVFHDSDGGTPASAGFDALVGNPPWEMLRRGDGTSHSRASELAFIRESGLYSSCGRGHLNLYQPFVERALSLLKPGGRAGLVLPWSFATDDGSAELRRRLTRHSSIDSILGLHNSAGLFPIHRGLRFAAIVVANELRPSDISLRAGLSTAAEIETLPDSEDQPGTSLAPVRVSTATLSTIGGPLLRIPDLRSSQDLDWLAGLCRSFPALGSTEGWRATFGRELNATEDASALGTDGLPVIDGKHIGQFEVHVPADVRRITARRAARKFADGRHLRARLGYRDVSGFGNRHALIAAIVPGGVVTTHTIFCLRQPLDAERQHFLCALLNSGVIDRYVRMFMGSHVTTSLVEQIPAPRWTGGTDQRAISGLSAALSGSDPGLDRSAVRQELEARVARLYGFG